MTGTRLIRVTPITPHTITSGPHYYTIISGLALKNQGRLKGKTTFNLKFIYFILNSFYDSNPSEHLKQTVSQVVVTCDKIFS